MITAVDTSVLIDIVTADVRFGAASAAALRRALAEGAVIACDAVWAETAGWFEGDEGPSLLRRLRIDFSPIDEAAASLAGRAWRAYRVAGGPRARLVADFLVGAHATTQADRLLTRDRGFHRRYFDSLTLLDPTQSDQ